ncbi:mechanosensitive ion channel family protein [Limibaculum sp. FT325]|uniref:mechanosensitive ion channel family protein n=1 Tax=Thermohalobaculum sediminis TaxID=2939436 RepID=UPI0020C060F5|nr:mechanosensitive ion channel family protein [Limibaculum sediminis]MCL5776102.1 mechanosensitive ion channel family protein [Limibaculum sediminis]
MARASLGRRRLVTRAVGIRARLRGVVAGVALLLAAVLAGAPAAARGEGTQAPTPDAIARIVAAAQDAGVPLVVVGAPPPAPAAEPPPVGLAERAARLSKAIGDRLERDAEDLADAPETMPALLARLSGEPGADWVWRALAVVAVTLLAGILIERLAAARLMPALLGDPPAGDAGRSARLRFALGRAAILAGAAVAGLGAAFLLAAIAVRHAPAQVQIVMSAFEVAILIRATLLFFRVTLAPYEPAARLLAVEDGLALRAYRGVVLGAVGTGMLAVVSAWLDRIEAPGGLADLAATVVSAMAALVLGRAAWRLRHVEAVPGRAPLIPWLARSWPQLAVLYLIVAVAATVGGRLSGVRTEGLIIAPISAAMLAALLYSLSLLVVDRAFPPTAEDAALPSFRVWAERSVLALAGMTAAGILLDAWGAGPFEADGQLRPVFTILIVLVVAWIGWSAIRTAFDRRLALERAAAGPVNEDADEGGAGGTRIETILPLFRNAILIAIGVIAAMVMLSAVGVDVAPLFAGAGLVGIAVGFGAQTLVRDIFSGVFFLIDDAFRVGEYIDTGGAKGTVERISIRSMQLRHHTGPLHTIPFGEIHQLTNFSRDWVIMKLPIRVRFGTDTERVRKLVKKLGQELLADPVIGAKFVEPLKSQGVYQMDEYGIVMRVKFKTRPGDQFAVRKVVYQKINELFEREGIAFGGREVVVRSADGGPAGAGASPADLAAAGAADAAAGGVGSR